MSVGDLVALRDLVFMPGFDEIVAQIRLGPIKDRPPGAFQFECQTLHPQIEDPVIETADGWVTGIHFHLVAPIITTRAEVRRVLGPSRELDIALDEWGGPLPEEFLHATADFTGRVVLDIARGSIDDALAIVNVIIRRRKRKAASR